MVDTPSSILLLRLQGTGDNVDLWGGYLNTALSTVERAAKGYQSLAMTGDATVSWSNYSASNTGEVAFLKLTGTLTSAASLTMPNYQQLLCVWNATGQAITIKCAGQTGVAVPNGVRTVLFCDGTDFASAAPTWLATTTSGNNNDIITKSVMDSAIAASFTATFGAGGTIKITSSDTTPKYFSGAITTQISGLVSLAVATLNPGGNEQSQFTLTTPALSGTYAGTITSGTVAMTANGRFLLTGGQADLPTMSANDSVIVQFDPAAGTTVTVGRNSQTIDGAAENDTYTGDGSTSPVIRYSYLSAGAVKSEIIGSVP